VHEWRHPLKTLYTTELIDKSSHCFLWGSILVVQQGLGEETFRKFREGGDFRWVEVMFYFIV